MNHCLIHINDTFKNRHLIKMLCIGFCSIAVSVNTQANSTDLTFDADVYSSWGTGYCARIKVTNTGLTIVDHPTDISFSLASNTTISSSWNGIVSREGKQVQAVYPSWVSSLNPGTSKSYFGFCTSGTSHSVCNWNLVTDEPEPIKIPAEFSAKTNIFSSWANGYCAKILVTNTGSRAARPEDIRFLLAPDTQINNSWNGTVTRTDETLNVAYPGWAGQLQVGQTQQYFGYCASGTGHPYDLYAYEDSSTDLPTNSTTAGIASAEVTPENSIQIIAPYSDDENHTNSISIAYKQHFESNWTAWETDSTHSSTPCIATITDLEAGTSYDIRITFSDTDGITGNSVQIISSLMLAGGGDTSVSDAFARGINLPNTSRMILSKEDIARWKSWGINTMRIGFGKDDPTSSYIDAPVEGDIWLPYTQSKARLQRWLTWMAEYNITAMVTLDQLWGDGIPEMWGNQGNNPYLQHRIALAGAMAEWLAQFPSVKYLEVWNEPNPYNNLYRDYFLPTVINEIRDINQQIEIVCMSPFDWGLLQGLKTGMVFPEQA